MKKTIEQRYAVTAVINKPFGIEVQLSAFSQPAASKTDEEIVATKLVKAAATAMTTIMPSMFNPLQSVFGILLTPEEYQSLKLLIGDVLLLKITKLQVK